MSSFNAGTVTADIEIDRGKLQSSVSDAIGEFHRLSAEGGQAGEQTGQQFVRGVDGRLRDIRGKFVSEITAAGGAASNAAESLGQRAGHSAAQGMGRGGTEAGEGFIDKLKNALDGGGLADLVKSKLKDMVSSGAGVAKLAGAGVGLALVGSLVTAINMEPARAKLTAQLGLTGPESARLGGVAGKLYAANYGEGLEDVTGAIRSVIQNIDGMRNASSEDLQQITAKVMSLSSAFDQDLGATTRAVGQMIRTGLAKDANEALDIITVGFQHGADKAEDFLDTLNEYGTQFRKLGIDGKTATGLITQGLQAGARDADIVADAFKEFAIRAIDGSKLTSDSFKALGLDAVAMQKAVAAGGSTAAQATDSVLDALRNVKDPAERAAIATGLFGTQAEDLGQALFALDLTTAVDGLGKIEGAASEVDRVMGDTAAGGLTSIARGLQVLADQVGSALLPVLKPLIVGMAGLGEAIGDVLGWVIDLPGPLLAGAAALVGWQIVSALGPALSAFAAATGRAALAVRGFIAAMGPVGLILTAVTVALSFFNDSSADTEAAIAAQDEWWNTLLGTLDKVSGATTEATRAQVTANAQNSGMLDTLERLGISTKLYVDASTGVAGATDKLGAAAQEAAGKVLQQSAAYQAVAEDLAAAGISQREFTNALTEADPAVAAQKMAELESKVNAYAEAQARATGNASVATEIQARFAAAIAEGTPPLEALGGILNIAGTQASGFGEAADKAAQAGRAMGTDGQTGAEGVDALGGAAAGATEAIDPMKEALDAASAATSALDAATQFLSITLDAAAGGIISVETAQRANDAATREMTAATRDHAQAIDDQTAAEQAVKTAIDEHGAGSREATEAQRDYENSTDDAKAATDRMFDAGKKAAEQALTYAGTLLQNGRANGTLQQATQQATAAVGAARSAFIAAQSPADQLSGKADRAADALFGIPKDTVARISEQGAAATRGAADGVSGAVNSIPGQRTTGFSAIDNATGVIARIQSALNGMQTYKQIVVETVVRGNAVAVATGGVLEPGMEYAADGLITGRGTSTMRKGAGNGVTWAEGITGREYYLSMNPGQVDRNRQLAAAAVAELGGQAVFQQNRLRASAAEAMTQPPPPPAASPAATRTASSRVVQFGDVNVGSFQTADQLFDRALWEVMG